MGRCFGYGRASTDKQEATEDAQREDVERFFDRHLKQRGVQYAGWYYDPATSGGTRFSEREDGLKVWILAQPGDYILVRHADRMFRDAADAVNTLAALEQKGVVVQTTDSALRRPGKRGATEELLDTMLAGVNQYAKRITGERTSSVMRSLVAKGVKFGRAKSSAPIGWMRHGDGISPDMEERDRVDRMAEWRQAEGLSFERLAMRVNYPPYCWRRRYSVGKASGWDKRSIRLALTARQKGWPKVFLHARARRGAATRTPEPAGT